jgi:hypothetical protein
MPPKRGIQPGEVRNPKGAGAHKRNVLKQEFRKLTEEQVRQVLTLVLTCRPENFEKEIGKNPTVLKAWLGAVALKGIRRGDIVPLLAILDRVIGRVKATVSVESFNGPQIVVSLPSNGREAKDVISEVVLGKKEDE